MKIGYIISILTIAIMIVLSGCGKTAEQPAVTQPTGEQPAPQQPTEAEGTAKPEMVDVVPEEKIQVERSSAPEGTNIMSNFGCDATAKTVSFTVTNVGEKALTIDNGQGRTGYVGGMDAGEKNDWIKVQFNGVALRKLTCGKLDLATGESTDCSQNEELRFRTTTSSAYSKLGVPAIPYNQLEIKTQTGDQEKQVYCS